MIFPGGPVSNMPVSCFSKMLSFAAENLGGFVQIEPPQFLVSCPMNRHPFVVIKMARQRLPRAGWTSQ